MSSREGLRLLSLDGGGIRGLSELIILKEILNRIEAQENLKFTPLPCTYFDMIGGTSTGGIIAILLGRLRMSIDEAIKSYASFAAEVFSSRNHLRDAKFKTSTLEKVIKQIVKDHTRNEEERMMDVSNRACKTFVCAVAAENMQSPRLFRTYDVPENKSINCTIWEAARATFAMVNFFKDIEITEGGVKERFIDGGVGCNNPIRQVLQEAELSFPGRRVACVLSIGTGQMVPIRIPKSSVSRQWTLPRDVIKTLEMIATNCEKTADEVQRLFKKQPNVYFRLNVEQGMQDITLARWESMGTVKTHTIQYLERVGVNEKVKNAVKVLREKQGIVSVEQLNGIESPKFIADKNKELLLKIRSWLLAPDPAINFNRATETRHGDTGQWFIEGSVFGEWKSRPRSFLWIHGIPGSGKTILRQMCSRYLDFKVLMNRHCSSTIINYIKRAHEGNSSIALGYFFFDFGNPATQRCRSLIYSLVTQLCQCCDAVPSTLVNLYNQDGGTTEPAMNELKMALKELLEVFPHAYIILDALDECDGSERTAILKFLKEIICWELGNLHLLVTSRNEGDIEKYLQPLVSSEMDLAKFVNRDIQTYLSDFLETLEGWNEREVALIQATLMNQADGMFLLVRSQLEEVENCLTVNDLKTTLADLPKSLEERYERILNTKVQERHRGYVLKVLQWLAFSFQPVKLPELVVVLEFDLEKGQPDADNKFRDPRDVVKICSAMVNLDAETGAVKLSHSSVKEFLISTTRAGLRGWWLKFDPVLVHTIMARTCLAYLLQLPHQIGAMVTSDFPLALYAAKYWTKHIHSEDVSSYGPIRLLIRSLLQQNGTRYCNWVRLHDIDHPWSLPEVYRSSNTIPSPLYYAVLIGLLETSTWLINEGADVNAQGGWYGNALQAASYGGRDRIVRLFLENGADVNAQGGRHGNALQAASYCGHEGIVRLLVENGVDINARGGWSGNALQAASEGGHEEIVRLLVENGADVNAQGGWYGNALQAASCDDHERVVQLLMETGADVNAQGGEYGNALQATSYKGHEKIARLLLESGADSNAQGGMYGNALQAASYGGHEEAVRLLLENGADVNARGGEYGNALQAASYGGHERILRLLVGKGADVNAQGGRYGSALHAASYGGQEKIVQLLLKNGADVNAQGGWYGNALQVASEGGHERIVRLLMEKGADVNAQGGKYGNALQAASYGGHEGVFRLLVEKGADVSAQGGWYGNALQAASEGAHEDIVRLLVENGADVNAQGGEYGNSLQAASYDGDEGIVRLLVEKGADVNAQGGVHGNALQAASYGGHEEIVRLLADSVLQFKISGSTVYLSWPVSLPLRSTHLFPHRGGTQPQCPLTSVS